MRNERCRRWLREAAVLFGASFLLACGSGGDSGADGGTSKGTSTTGNITWKDDGVGHTVLIASAAIVKSAQMDLLQISGGESSGVALSFGIVAKPTLVPGSFTCASTGTYPIVSFVYTAPGTGTLVDSCAIEITTIGAKTGDRTTGTFSTTVPLTAGGKKLVNEGKFDLPTTVSSLN